MKLVISLISIVFGLTTDYRNSNTDFRSDWTYYSTEKCGGCIAGGNKFCVQGADN
jgi:hypothetical protein